MAGWVTWGVEFVTLQLCIGRAAPGFLGGLLWFSSFLLVGLLLPAAWFQNVHKLPFVQLFIVYLPSFLCVSVPSWEGGQASC